MNEECVKIKRVGGLRKIAKNARNIAKTTGSHFEYVITMTSFPTERISGLRIEPSPQKSAVIERKTNAKPASVKSQITVKTAVHRGFALVVTLTLLILLSIIVVSFLSLAMVSSRTLSHDLLQEQARANARMGLVMAIGKLQKFAGPDQRITASADLLGFEKNAMWTGVWSTVNDQGKPMVSDHSPSSAGYFTDLRNNDENLKEDKWKNELRLAWLVSGELLTPDELSSLSAEKAITLVSEASLGGSAETNDPRLVSAPYVLAKSDENSAGGYAFWIGDESQKARIDLVSPHHNIAPDPASPENGGLYLLAGAGGPDFTDVKSDAENQPYQDIRHLSAEERSKLLSLQSISLGLASPKGVASPNFHDITTSSRGLLSNVVMGGLQKDLTAVLEREAPQGSLEQIPSTLR